MKATTKCCSALFSFALAAASSACTAETGPAAEGEIGTVTSAYTHNVEIVHEENIGSVPWVQGGDADVTTKSGRKTDVWLQATEAYLEAENSRVRLTVEYGIYEEQPNNTMLWEHRYAYLPYNTNWTVNGIWGTDYSYSDAIEGRDHNTHDLPISDLGSYVKKGTIKFDDVGRDDRGNAWAKLTLRVSASVTE